MKHGLTNRRAFMIKKYRAYDESADKWLHFKLIADEEGWEIRYYHGSFGDKSKAKTDENMKVAYSNMLRLIARFNLTKLAEIDE